MRTSRVLLFLSVFLFVFCLVPLAIASPWSVETVSSAGDVGRFTSCKVSSAGVVHVAYQDVTGLKLGYARKSGASWSFESPDVAALPHLPPCSSVRFSRSRALPIVCAVSFRRRRAMP
jgi:hypothetical protein